MREHLVWTIAGPMGSFGESARAERRRTALIPPRSALAGMVAAALGIERGDDSAHGALNRYGFAVQSLGESTPLRDYHTVQSVPESVTDTAARGAAISRAGHRIHTLVTIRDYRTVIAMRATMWADTPRWTLAEIAQALRAPAFPLYMGRKSCPLASPTCPLLVHARHWRRWPNRRRRSGCPPSDPDSCAAIRFPGTARTASSSDQAKC